MLLVAGLLLLSASAPLDVVGEDPMADPSSPSAPLLGDVADAMPVDPVGPGGESDPAAPMAEGPSDGAGDGEEDQTVAAGDDSPSSTPISPERSENGANVGLPCLRVISDGIGVSTCGGGRDLSLGDGPFPAPSPPAFPDHWPGWNEAPGVSLPPGPDVGFAQVRLDLVAPVGGAPTSAAPRAATPQTLGPAASEPQAVDGEPAASQPIWLEAVAAAAVVPTVMLLKFLAALVVRRRRSSRRRDVLRELIAADPGIHHMELVRRSGFGNGAVQHHLRSLVEEGLVARVRTAGHTCFFPGPGGDPEVIAVRLAARSPATRKVMQLLAQQPRTLTALAQETGLPVTTMHYHVSKLTRAGALARDASAGRRALGLTPLGQRALEAGLNGTS